MNTIQEKYKERQERLQRQVSVKEGHIVVNVEFEYNIDLRRCQTHEQILAWAYHLCEKTWMTTEVMRRFVLVACQENGLEIPRS
jgi:hypothetical protein